MQITILSLHDIMIDYCKNNNKSLIHYKITYETSEEKEEILFFYSDKIPFEIHESLKIDDDNFIIFNKVDTALEYAETIFPYKPEIEATNSRYFIPCCVFNENGEYVWDNNK